MARRLLLLLPLCSQALRLARQAGDCAQVQASVRYQDLPEPLPGSAEQLALEWWRGNVTEGDLTNLIFTSRHRCCRLENRTLPVPQFMRMFDWYQLGDEGENVSHPEPTTVLCRANTLDRCWQHVSALPPLREGQKRLLAIGQEDIPLSENLGAVQPLLESRLFSRVLYEATDVRVPGIDVMPMGLNNWYLQMNGVEGVRKAVLSASLQRKAGGVLAAWGQVWAVLDKRLASRRAAEKFTEGSCLVHRSMVPMDEYWQALAEHRFLLAPSGVGVQSSKVVEALMVLTIPIVNREVAFENLQKRGWPLAIVDRWEEITPERLLAWHRELAPRLPEFRLRLTAQGAFRDVLAAL